MTNVLSPTPKLKFFGNDGKPAVGYKLFTYEAGTDTKLATYPDENMGVPNSNPIVLDFRGECSLWTPPNVAYKYVFSTPTDTDPPTNPIWTVDHIVNSQLVTLWGGVDTGIADAYMLNFVANFSSYAEGIVIYWIPSNTNSGASTINVNGLGPVAIINQDGTTLLPGQLPANQVAIIVYKGTGFLLLSSQIQSVYGGNDTGAANNYILNAAQFPVLRDGLLIYWVAANTNTGASNINVNGLGVKQIVNQNISPLAAGQIVTGEISTIIYRAGVFILLSNSIPSGAFTANLTGMAAPVSFTVDYYISGNIISLSCQNKALDKTGTSNSTAMKLIGLPNIINPGNISTQFCGYVIDNGLIKSSQVQVFNNEVSFFLGFDGGTLFTGSGTKGLNKNWNLIYQRN